ALRLHRSARFPYTTLFRSLRLLDGRRRAGTGPGEGAGEVIPLGDGGFHQGGILVDAREGARLAEVIKLSQLRAAEARIPHDGGRSEEHTSELQSRENLVCR